METRGLILAVIVILGVAFFAGSLNDAPTGNTLFVNGPAQSGVPSRPKVAPVEPTTPEDISCKEKGVCAGGCKTATGKQGECKGPDKNNCNCEEPLSTTLMCFCIDAKCSGVCYLSDDVGSQCICWDTVNGQKCPGNPTGWCMAK